MIDPQGADTVPAYQKLGHIDALPAGIRLGEFEIQGLLGFGGFGMVYKGYDHSLHRAVAIKEYMPTALAARADSLALSVRSAQDAHTFHAGLQSFIAEARLLARFDHPSLVKVYRFWEANNTAYMAMPLYQGITLKQARKQMSSPPPEDWLRVIIWSVLEALKVLHSSDALHRDVSPDNIFLQNSGPPVLLDLGSARLAVIEGNKKHTAILKVNYAPIEQYADVSDMREGPWTDIYALAAVIHGCICNEAPLPATIRVVRDRLPSMAKIAKTTETHFGQTYTSSFVKAIDQALSVQPGNRPQSVEAFAKALKLRSVAHPHRFDWRHALGERVTLSSVEPNSASTVFGASTEVDETVPFSRPKDAEATRSVQSKAVNPVEVQPSKGLGKAAGLLHYWRYALLGGVLLLVLLAWMVYTAAVSLKGSARAEFAVAPLSVVANPAVIAPPEFAASVPTPVMAEMSLPKEASPLSSLESTAQQRSLKLPRVATSVSKSQDDQKLNSTKASLSKGSEVQATEEVVVSSSSAPASAVVREPVTLCKDSNLFTKPMCIYQECQKPQHAALQVCIDDKKRWEERDRARQ